MQTAGNQFELANSFMHTLVHIQEEKEAGDARFTKLKLQAKAKMAALNKQISELKGQEGLNVSQVSETKALTVVCH